MWCWSRVMTGVGRRVDDGGGRGEDGEEDERPSSLLVVDNIRMGGGSVRTRNTHCVTRAYCTQIPGVTVKPKGQARPLNLQ